MQAGKHDESIEEVSNMRYAMFAAVTKLDFKNRAFACFVHKIDDDIITDTSVEGLSKIVKMFSEEGLTVEELDLHWETVKKKLIRNFEPIFQDGLEMTLNSLTTSENGIY